MIAAAFFCRYIDSLSPREFRVVTPEENIVNVRRKMLIAFALAYPYNGVCYSRRIGSLRLRKAAGGDSGVGVWNMISIELLRFYRPFEITRVSIVFPNAGRLRGG